eukprot:2929431-Rhodomonas_salina.1
MALQMPCYAAESVVLTERYGGTNAELWWCSERGTDGVVRAGQARWGSSRRSPSSSTSTAASNATEHVPVTCALVLTPMKKKKPTRRRRVCRDCAVFGGVG